MNAQIAQILLPLGAAGGLLGVAALVRYAVLPAAWDWLSAQRRLWRTASRMPKPSRPAPRHARDWTPKHAFPGGTPALVAPAAHEGATELWSPDEEVTKVGPGRLREDIGIALATEADPQVRLALWLDDDKSDDDLAREAAELEDEYREILRPVNVALSAFDRQAQAEIDAWMRRAEITWDDVREWRTNTAATAVMAAVHGDIGVLNEQLKNEVALATPTGEYPIYQGRAKVAMPV